jgi:hypothetical protein
VIAKQTAAGSLSLISFVAGASAAFADPAAECGDRSEWTAKPREWMSGDEAWCAIEVGFRYAGSSGDIKVAVKKQVSARAALANLASVDLPANGGETSAFQFIFPCAAERAAEMCLVYETAADALELSYDYLELGADTNTAPDGAPAPGAVTDAVPDEQPRSAPSPALAGFAEHRLSTADQARDILFTAVAADAAAPRDFARARHDFDLLGAVEPPTPVAVPISELRRRAR